MRVHNEEWIRYFRARGHAAPEPLAAGMEGAVYRLGDGLIAKVWGDKSHAELTALQQFYHDLSRQSLPFSTPEILEVQDVEGTFITFERELLGRPLQEFLSEDDTSAPSMAERCLTIVLSALASVETRSALALPVLSEREPFRGDASWSDALVRLLHQRVVVFGDQLRAAVPDFDALYDHLVAALNAPEVRGESVIHGDICGVNILVDQEMTPTAVLDWGFLSTSGDPAFDASVSAGIFNMYGPHAQDIDRQLLQYFAVNLGLPIHRLLVYRAAYAVATSNAYDLSGKDGHFAWCAACLRREDIRAALEQNSAR